jgi:hypothetical protein
MIFSKSGWKCANARRTATCTAAPATADQRYEHSLYTVQTPPATADQPVGLLFGMSTVLKNKKHFEPARLGSESYMKSYLGSLKSLQHLNFPPHF